MGNRQGEADFAHAMTSGLFAGVRARQVADRSVGYSAAFCPAPQKAMSRVSSSLHCAVQPVALQFARTIRTGDDEVGPQPAPGRPESMGTRGAHRTKADQVDQGALCDGIFRMAAPRLSERGVPCSIFAVSIGPTVNATATSVAVPAIQPQGPTANPQF